jgi:membrane-bound serine protease (ClpP class)
LLRRLATPLLAFAIIATLAGPASAATGPRAAQISVVKVTGLIDPLNADLLSHAVGDAASGHDLVLIVQLNSTGGVIPQPAVDRLAARIHASSVPVAVWVGGSGRPRALGAAYELLRAAAYAGVGPGARIGDAPAPTSGTPDPLTGHSVGPSDALVRHLVDVSTPTLGDFLVGLDGRSLAGGPPLHVADVVTQNGQPRRQLRHDVDITFNELTVFPRILHSVASPNVAFAMLLIALALAVFEFYTAGVGVAAGTAALFGALAAYGFGVLPTRPLSLALLFLAVLGLAIDVQAGAPRVWTGVGIVAFVIGAIRLYAGLSVSLWVVVTMGLLVVLFMVAGMPAMVRTRFSTPTIGRTAMIGGLGVALSGVDPDGTVEVNGAPWRARTNRATPIGSGEPIRVIAIDGLVLEVEPEAGGAREAHH